MWILKLQSPFCFTWKKVVHTAPQNSTGNEVNMGSRNSEYLNYRFLYVKLTKIVIYSSDASKKSTQLGLICLKVWTTWHVGNKDNSYYFISGYQWLWIERKRVLYFFFKVDIIKLKWMVLIKHSLNPSLFYGLESKVM